MDCVLMDIKYLSFLLGKFWLLFELKMNVIQY